VLKAVHIEIITAFSDQEDGGNDKQDGGINFFRCP
jgi:hypothetical protein